MLLFVFFFIYLIFKFFFDVHSPEFQAQKSSRVTSVFLIYLHKVSKCQSNSNDLLI